MCIIFAHDRQSTRTMAFESIVVASMNSIAEEFVCPITQELPLEPVTAEDGRIYERNAIERCIRHQRDNVRSPYTNERMGDKLLPALQVFNTIRHLVESKAIDEELSARWKERMEEKKRVERMRSRAESGDTEAMYTLGRWCTDGQNLPKDERSAFKWYKKAADNQCPKGMAAAGFCLLFGCGVERNEPYAVHLLSLAANCGCDVACCVLGEIYYHGDCGFPQDEVLAQYWLTKVVDKTCAVSHITNQRFEIAKSLLEKLRTSDPQSYSYNV